MSRSSGCPFRAATGRREAARATRVEARSRLPDEQVEVTLRSEALKQALSALPWRERQVIILRYGLVDSEPKTLEEIGRRLGLTRERVRQVEVESLRRLSKLQEMERL